MELIVESLRASLSILFEMSPYILAGLFLSGVINQYVPDEKVKSLASPGFKGPLLSSLVGVPLPLCSCSVLPFALQMKKSGGSSGSALAFLTSTPQTGVDSIFVAYSFFGLPFALFKAIASFITGTVGGWLSDLLVKDTSDPVEEAQTCSCGSSCGSTVRKKTFWEQVVGIFRHGFDELLGDFSVPLVVGIIVAGVISVLFPEDFFGTLKPAWLYYPAVLLLSVPFYICATSSIPVAAALVLKGMPVGGAIIFLIAGPATNIATLGIVAKTLGKKNTIIYLGNIIFFSLFAGVLFDFLQINIFPAEIIGNAGQAPNLFESIVGFIFGALLLLHLLKKLIRAH